MGAALYGGLLRLGLPLPQAPGLGDIHGPLMIVGVFGTLISLERAVAIGLAWPYLAPSGFALASILMVAGAAGMGAATATVAAAVFVAATIWITAQQRALFTATLALASAVLLAGTAQWYAGAEVPDVAGWWVGFLVLTIAAERLELSRFMTTARAARWSFGFVVAIVVSGAALGFQSQPGRFLMGAGLVGLAGWLVRHDIAMRTVRLRGQPRFMAAAMLLGYGWLAVTGALLISGWPGAFAYDLGLHGVLIGFVLSMVFGHALIIFPAISGIALTYRPALYLPLVALHLSVAMRAVGDVLEADQLRLASGSLTVLALAGFALLLALGRRRIKSGQG